jgi:hypothetical protein
MAEPGRGLVLHPAGQSLTGASFTSVEQFKEHIDAFIKNYNEDAEPFVWTKSKVHQRRVSCGLGVRTAMALPRVRATTTGSAG